MWIDITQTLTNDIAEWPGDEPFKFGYSVTKEESGNVNIGKLSTSVHIGTHMDAPFHYDNEGITIEQIDVNRLVGEATILEIFDKDVITQKDLEQHIIKGTVVLIKTQEKANPNQFKENIPVLNVEAIEYLASQGVKVFGIDVSSVDTVDSKSLDNHHAFKENDITNIENLLLEHVTGGFYNFIGLPLKIKGADGSPIRAIIEPKH